MRHLSLPRPPAGPAWRPRPLAVGLALSLAVLAALAGFQPGARLAAHASDLTVSQDNLRTGWDSAETAMSPGAVKSFTKLFSTAVSGQVYAQPLVIDSLSTVVVATETDQVYGLDAATGAVKWHTSLGTPYPMTYCGDLAPKIGVTGAPVYDSAVGANGTVYMVAQTGGATPIWGLWGVNPVTGTATKVATIGGHPANDPSITLSPKMVGERPGLLLLNGWVYAAFGSHCDKNPYAGYVAGVNVTTKKVALWTDESGVTNNRAGVWQSGGGLMSDGSGRIFVTSGNGISPPTGVGTKPPGTLAESVIRLGVNGTTGALTARDFYSPANAPTLDAADRDWGSGGPVGLPFGVSNGKVSYPHLVTQVGKDGRIFLLNRDSLGGRNKGPALFISAAYGGEWGHPAVFAGTSALTPANAAKGSDYLFYVGKNDPLRVFRFGVSGTTGKPTLSNVASSSLIFHTNSGSPVITSNGADPTTAVAWVTYSPASNGVGSVLEAYNVSSTALGGCKSAAPCSLTPIFSAPVGTSAKFTVVATSAGRVYVGTRDGHVIGFGAPAAAVPLTAQATSLGQAGVSTTASKTVTVTAAKATTVTGVAAATGASNAPAPGTQFAVTQVTVTKKGSSKPIPVTYPVKLAKGDKLHAAVTFTPAAPGGTDGSLVVSEQSASLPVVNVPLAGYGTQPGLYAPPGGVDFQEAPDQGVIDVPVGIVIPSAVDITNYGTTAYTVLSVTAPTGPFTATGLPAVGTKIAPGQSISVGLAFAPATAGPVTGSFTIAGSNGPATTVQLTGVGTAAVSNVTAAKPVVNFGTVAVGKTATAYVLITNNGNTAATVTGTAVLPAPYQATLTPTPGLPFNPEYDLRLPVTFTPKKAGNFTAKYKLTWTDLNGKHTLVVLLTGTAA